MLRGGQDLLRSTLLHQSSRLHNLDLVRQCPRDGNSLQLPAGEFVRIAPGVLGFQLYPLQQLIDAADAL